MTTLYNGGPVMGGTFPALIWARVISAWRDIQAEHAAEKAARKAATEDGEDSEPAEAESYVPSEEGTGSEGTPEPEPEVVEPTPETEATPEATPEEATPEATPEEAAPEAAPESGGGGGVTAG
jgi:hypothetical protein